MGSVFGQLLGVPERTVHGIFANDIDQVLLQSGLTQLITTNTIPHRSNRVEIADLLVAPVRECLQAARESTS